MLPRFADIFQQGNRWLNWLHKQPEGSVRPVVIEAVTKIMACGTTLMGYTCWRCSDRGGNNPCYFPPKSDITILVLQDSTNLKYTYTLGAKLFMGGLYSSLLFLVIIINYMMRNPY